MREINTPQAYAVINRANGRVITIARGDAVPKESEEHAFVAIDDLSVVPKIDKVEQYLIMETDPETNESHFEVREIEREIIEAERARVRELIAAARYEAEIAGVDVSVTNGTVRLATDPVSQGKLTALLVWAERNPMLSVEWKGADGVFVEISAADVRAMANAVFAHVQQQFRNEARLAEALQTATTMAAIKAVEKQIPAVFGTAGANPNGDNA